jgi:ADP-heptose:LPS heptosyltransferase
MGSTILVDPAMRKVARELPESESYFLIFESAKDSLALLGTIPQERIQTIQDQNFLKLTWSTIRVIFWMWRKQIDTVIDLELFSRFTALLTGLSLAPRRIGFFAFHHEGLSRGRLLTHQVAYNSHQHISKNFLSLTHALLSEVKGAPPELPYSKILIPDSEISLAQAPIDPQVRIKVATRIQTLSGLNPLKHPVILFNPNASDMLPQRRWAYENYAELISRVLVRLPDALALITGAPAERETAEKVRTLTLQAAHQKGQKLSPSRVMNFAGEVKLRELPALYDLSAFMVSNDSGPAHFASVTRMPTFVFFGPETPLLYGALGRTTPIYAGLACSPCVAATNHRKTPCSDNQCLKVITPDWAMRVLEPEIARLEAAPKS